MSGTSKKRRLRFLQEHPYCCFCGGLTATTTEDHIPARSIFAGRKWPEGYVFPACEACNNGSSSDELLVAWLSRIRIENYRTEEELREFERLHYEVKRRFPKIAGSLREMSRLDTRRLAKQANLHRLATDDLVYSVTIPQELIDAFQRYGVKLAKALHYKHSGRIVPLDAVVRAYVLTNTEALTSDTLPRVLASLPSSPVLQRSNTPLGSQFSYQFGVAEQGEASAFLIFFGQSTVISAFVFCDRARYLSSKAAELMQAPVPPRSG